jgi:hypothetical protein
MVKGAYSVVLYIVNAIQMKTHHTSTTPINVANNWKLRLILTLTGIIAAVLCAVALMQDVRSASRWGARPGVIEASRVVASTLASDFKAML